MGFPLLKALPILLLLMLAQGSITTSSNNSNGLKLRLMHKNSPDSPFRKIYATHRERIADLLAHDLARIGSIHALIAHRRNRHAATNSTHPQLPFPPRARTRRGYALPIVSGAAAGTGQYFVDFHVGTPPQKFTLVADTGSDLVWVRCSGCRQQCLRKPGSAFFARRSSTFRPIHCASPSCELVPGPPEATECNATRREHSSCMYDYVYADLSDSTGVFARDTATLNTSSGRLVRLRNVAFGCGIRSTGPSLTGSTFGGAHGVMGLGNGAISFASQIGRKLPSGGNKFSYCLVDYNLSPPRPSYLFLGRPRIPKHLHRSMRYTPFLRNRFADTFYYIGINQVWVGNRLLQVSPSVWRIDSQGNGGTIIDSGTTLSFLVQPAYRLLLKAFARGVKYPRIEHVQNFDLCYNVSGIRRIRFPSLSVVFEGGARFEPPPSNYFINVEENVKCLAFRGVASTSGNSVIGNLLQQNFLIVYDKQRSKLGFARTDCSFTA